MRGKPRRLRRGGCHTGDIAGPFTIGSEFLSYVIAIFIGFVIITPILNKVFGSSTT